MSTAWVKIMKTRGTSRSYSEISGDCCRGRGRNQHGVFQRGRYRSDCRAFRDRLIDAAGVRIGANDVYRMRAVTHLDVTRVDIERAAAAVRDLARSEIS